MPINRVSDNPFEVSFNFEQTPILWTIVASAPGNASLIRGGKSLAGTLEQNDTRTLGWISPTYGELKPAVSLVYRVKSSLPMRLITVLLVGQHFRLESNGAQISIYQAASELDRISLSPIESVVAREGSN